VVRSNREAASARETTLRGGYGVTWRKDFDLIFERTAASEPDMKISPRYDADPLVTLDGPPDAVGVPLVRQRRRFAAVLSSLSPAQWETPSRCEGWRVQDVVAHLAGVDRFWNLMIESGLAGTPTRFLADFDPKATPASLVDAVRTASPQETLAALLEASGKLCATVESLSHDGWLAIGESPAGHVTMTTLAHHALWDCWVHERDVLVPLGMAQDEQPDEIVASLRYAAALAPMFCLQAGRDRTGTLAVDVTRPDARFVVTVDDHVRVTSGDPPPSALVLTGGAVEVLESLSVRAPWRQPIPDHDAWLVASLAEVFEA
jgi:uncharacterized protein (TIGR03083 family)